MRLISTVLALGLLMSWATTSNAQCVGPNCPQAQYIQTPTIMPWNWGSRVIRLRRVRPAVTLQAAPQQIPQQPIPQPQQPQGRWQWIPGQ